METKELKMQPMIIQKNWKDSQLYCVYSKEKIEIGEDYIIESINGLVNELRRFETQ